MDIFNIIQIVQDTVIHLEVDEEQWKITQGCQRQAKWVWSPRTMSCRSTASRYSSCSTPNTTIHAFRPENNVGVSSQPMNYTRVLCLKQTKVTLLPKKSTMKIRLRRSRLIQKKKDRPDGEEGIKRVVVGVVSE